uniref:Uncharacterized protein n=1 Tax=Rhizophora mucronata TaxID=61149 RepID=A0A2P2IZR9_RHIMU
MMLPSWLCVACRPHIQENKILHFVAYPKQQLISSFKGYLDVLSSNHKKKNVEFI